MLTAQKINEQSSKITNAGKPSPFFSSVLQKKLSVGSAHDSYEVEADSVADRVIKMGDSSSQIKHTGSLVQRKCAECEEREKLQKKSLAEGITPLVQRKSTESGGNAPSHVENQINSNKGRGSLMDNGTRNFMESRFGADFSDVRIHTGTEAVQMSRELSAQAFTVGNDIYFNEGKYSPTSDSGKHLLAHELTHTLQQGGDTKRKIQKLCTPAATCSAPISGSASYFGDSEVARESASRVRRQGMTPTRALQNSHAGLAGQLEIFINGQDPTLLTKVRGVFIDMDLSPGTGALTQDCVDWETLGLPAGARLQRIIGRPKCIFVHGNLNQQALQFNRTTNATIGNLPREIWRIQTLQTITHEVQHVVYDDVTHLSPSGITTATCTSANLQHELSELNAKISEFPPLFRSIPAVAPASHSLNVQLSNWFDYVSIGGGEDIRGILLALGCSCDCGEVTLWVRNTFNFLTSSWAPNEKIVFNAGVKARVPAWPL